MIALSRFSHVIVKRLVQNGKKEGYGVTRELKIITWDSTFTKGGHDAWTIKPKN